MLLGSWFVIFGNQNQVVNLWRFEKGYTDLDSHIKSLLNNPALKAVELEYARLCGRRRTVITKPFSYWGEPKERTTPHIYDLRSYVLKPGTMIEWGNAWAKGITYRREFNQDVVNRNTTRQMTWNKPGWDSTVEYTVPLIKKMQSRILVPNELSKLK
uniref:NIPSNAP domain-containing protein n=1 Tax=Meloidogyne hapla TaxID=6305 RepID=A0A1I8AY11_MELHA